MPDHPPCSLCAKPIASGLGDAKQLERTTPDNVTIKFGRTSGGFRKIEFGHQLMGDLFYEMGRTCGGFCKIHLSRQVAGNLNYDLSRTQFGDGKQFGQVIGGFIKEAGRVLPNSIPCGRVVPGYIQLKTQACSL